ncbi:MAG: ATP-dependent Clp protease adaptor ClpS [Flavobacteriaceae bacterium]|jgi:ATP-dependent Clp protease adaptor protein ClpS
MGRSQIFIPTLEEVSTEETPEIRKAVLSDKEHELILYNDDVNTFDHVIRTLIAVCDHTAEQAEQCAYLVHFKGKCTVKSGSYAYLEPQCILLHEAGLSATIE